MSRQAGYVAAEALAALAILGLAVGGLATGLFTLGRGELTTTSMVRDAVRLHSMQDELQRLLREHGPFRSDDIDSLVGTAQRVTFACGLQICGGQLEAGRLKLSDSDGTVRELRLTGIVAPRWAYVGSAGPSDRWPPPQLPPPAPRWQVLRAVVLEDGASGRAVAVGRLTVQQAYDCEFDALVQDCRRAAE